MNEDKKIVEILLMEDNLLDIKLLEESLLDKKYPIILNVVNNGIEGIAYLRKEGHYLNSKCPDVILLDLNMPKMNGHEVLKVIKTDEVLRSIPVIVLTSSKTEEDLIRSYDNYANAYINKPIDIEIISKIIESLKLFGISM